MGVFGGEAVMIKDFLSAVLLFALLYVFATILFAAGGLQ